MRSNEEGRLAYSEHNSDNQSVASDGSAFGGPFSGPLGGGSTGILKKKRSSRSSSKKSARFNIPSDSSLCHNNNIYISNGTHDDPSSYVAIILDICDDSVEVHSVQTANNLEDPELALTTRALENKSNSCRSSIRQVSQEIECLASLSRRSSAAHALKGPKFNATEAGASGNGWPAVEKRFLELTSSTSGQLPSLFGECIGMNRESEEFTGELFQALARRHNISGDSINKARLITTMSIIQSQIMFRQEKKFFRENECR